MPKMVELGFFLVWTDFKFELEFELGVIELDMATSSIQYKWGPILRQSFTILGTCKG